MKVASASAGKTASAQAPDSDGSSEQSKEKDSKKEDIVDADFEVVDDDK